MSGPADLDLSNGPASRVTLRDGRSMPVVGAGLWRVEPGAVARSVVTEAIAVGYRLVDTATLYGNEADVAAGIAASGRPRSEIFVTTKLWNDEQGYGTALEAARRSRARLGGAPIDLYLIHWPVRGLRSESWRALGELQRSGDALSIGVSNFTVPQLEELAAGSSVVPVVNQVEFTPFLFQRDLLDHCRSHGIRVEAYSPLVRGQRFGDRTLGRIAAAHGRSPAQVILRWDLQHGVVPLPKSTHADRLRENLDLFGFSLSRAEMSEIDALGEGFRLGADPAQFG